MSDYCRQISEVWQRTLGELAVEIQGHESSYATEDASDSFAEIRRQFELATAAAKEECYAIIESAKKPEGAKDDALHELQSMVYYHESWHDSAASLKEKCRLRAVHRRCLTIAEVRTAIETLYRDDEFERLHVCHCKTARRARFMTFETSLGRQEQIPLKRLRTFDKQDYDTVVRNVHKTLLDLAPERGAERDGGPRLLHSRLLPSPFFGACRRIGRLRENNFRVDKFDEKDTEETVGVGTPCVLDAPPRGRGC